MGEIVRGTREEPPDGTSTHWNARSAAKRMGVGKDTIARVWCDHGLKPCQTATFKVPNDSRFEDKIVDVVGLYMNPPGKAVVFSFDEETQC